MSALADVTARSVAKKPVSMASARMKGILFIHGPPFQLAGIVAVRIGGYRLDSDINATGLGPRRMKQLGSAKKVSDGFDSSSRKHRRIAADALVLACTDGEMKCRQHVYDLGRKISRKQRTLVIGRRE